MPIVILGEEVGSEAEARFVLLRSLFTHGTAFCWDDRDHTVYVAGEQLEKLGLVSMHKAAYGAARVTLTDAGFNAAAVIAQISLGPVVIVEEAV